MLVKGAPDRNSYQTAKFEGIWQPEIKVSLTDQTWIESQKSLVKQTAELPAKSPANVETLYPYGHCYVVRTPADTDTETQLTHHRLVTPYCGMDLGLHWLR